MGFLKERPLVSSGAEEVYCHRHARPHAHTHTHGGRQTHTKTHRPVFTSGYREYRGVGLGKAGRGLMEM